MLSLSDVEYIAGLARIELNATEKQKFVVQISSILDYVSLLDEVDTTGVEITSQVTGLENVYRTDEVVGCSTEMRDMIIANFPAKSGDLLKVKGVFNS